MVQVPKSRDELVEVVEAVAVAAAAELADAIVAATAEAVWTD